MYIKINDFFVVFACLERFCKLLLLLIINHDYEPFFRRSLPNVDTLNVRMEMTKKAVPQKDFGQTSFKTFLDTYKKEDVYMVGSILPPLRQDAPIPFPLQVGKTKISRTCTNEDRFGDCPHSWARSTP